MAYCDKCGVEIGPGKKYCDDHRKEAKRDGWLKYARKHHTKPKPETERIERQCLKCNRPFMAEGRFTRICETCAKSNREVVDWGGISAISR